jgi:phosphopentomutase
MGRRRQPEGKIVEENGVKYRLVPAKPYYNAAKKMDLFENGLLLDEKVGKRTLELLEQNKDKRFFFFVHFAEVDHSGHKHGENSKEYNDALISNDYWTGKIADKLKELRIYDKTAIYITADHGFDEGKDCHKRAPYVFLGTNDKKVVRGGMRHDIAPTILERFGLKTDGIEPALDGTSLTQAAKNTKIRQ